MGFNSAFKGLKLLKNPGNGRLNNLNDPDRPQRVNFINKNQFLSHIKHGLFPFIIQLVAIHTGT